MGQREAVERPDYLRCWITARTTFKRHGRTGLHRLFDELVQQLGRHFAQLQLGCALGRVKVILYKALVHAAVILGQGGDLDLGLRDQPYS